MLVPLLLVIGVSMFIEGKEDVKRHQADNEINNRTARVLGAADFLDVQEEMKPWKGTEHSIKPCCLSFYPSYAASLLSLVLARSPCVTLSPIFNT